MVKLDIKLIVVQVSVMLIKLGQILVELRKFKSGMGKSPSFMTRAVVIKDAVGLNTFIIVHWPEYIRLTSIDVMACVKKYLVDASLTCGLNF